MSTFWCGQCGAALTRETEDAHKCHQHTDDCVSSDQYDRLLADRDALAAKVARVEALIQAAKLPSSENDLMVYADDLRTALDASETP